MPSDAYMELSDPAVWGETRDTYFGEEGRNWGAFEIFKFEFGVSAKEKDKDKKGAGDHTASGHPGHTTSGKAAAKH